MKSLICNTCKKELNENNPEEMIKHIFVDCGIPKNEEKRYQYYKKLVDFALNDVLKKIAEERFDLKNCHPDEFRSFWILLSVGFVKDNLFGTTPETAQTIYGYVPELALAMMDYAGLIKRHKRGKEIYFSKKEK